MAGARTTFGILFVVFLLAAAVSAAPEERVSADDVHLNAVLPEVEVFQTTKKVESDEDALSAASDDAPPHLELDTEPTTKNPSIAGPAFGPNHPTYFSRVITSIFEIPIAVLTAVRNLVNTATSPKVTVTTNNH